MSHDIKLAEKIMGYKRNCDVKMLNIIGTVSLSDI
jgi:hypothetical protein